MDDGFHAMCAIFIFISIQDRICLRGKHLIFGVKTLKYEQIKFTCPEHLDSSTTWRVWKNSFIKMSSQEVIVVPKKVIFF